MKRIAAILLGIPMLAYGGTDIVADPASAQACYQSLSSTSAKEEVLEAISCLQGNPFANEDTVKAFTKTQEALLAKYQQNPEGAEVGGALNGLAAQKSRRLYIAYTSRWNGRSVLVVDKAYLRVFPRPHNVEIVPIYDLGALNIKFAEKSSILSSDTTVPLQNVKAFAYQESPNGRRIGTLTTVHADNARVVDDSYQGEYPIRAYDSEDKHWKSISAFSGTLYSGNAKIENSKLALDQVGLSTFSVEFISEDTAKREIAQVEAAIQAKESAQTKANQVAANEAAAHDKKRVQNLAQMARAKLGSEDSCRRTDLNRWVVVKDPTAQDVEIDCQFGGLVNLKGLKDAGWLVVNKQWKGDVVSDYFIRKAR